MLELQHDGFMHKGEIKGSLAKDFWSLKIKKNIRHPLLRYAIIQLMAYMLVSPVIQMAANGAL